MAFSWVSLFLSCVSPIPAHAFASAFFITGYWWKMHANKVLRLRFGIGGVAVVTPFGKLYGLFNAKWLYIISNVIFMAASALCGAAPNMNAMIVGRVFAGAGGNGMYLGVLTLLSVNTTNKERPIYLSLV